MGSTVNQRNVTRNQSTADYSRKEIFLFDNRFSSGVFHNNSGGDLEIESGMLVVRSAGTLETADFAFVAGLTAAQTIIIAGLTYTSTGVTTAAQLANAFANLQDGATSGNGVSLGTYSGSLTGYSTGGVTSGVVRFTASTNGDKTNLTATGTGTLPVATIVNGTIALSDALIPATSSNLADVIGISDIEGSVEMLDTEALTISFATKGTILSNALVFPNGVTLDTLVGNKTLRDVLEGIGFHLESAVEHTKHEE